ncbi:uncharacterized protein LOC129407613 isoform X2 [Boleophthalmus pectinirostris]|uniref:uncharacterized protein LOC129407613 isoform X2 n=1 Tax=Boleophthalmus pectinirostris TaxID=150288 RepID=UPI00242C6578|nr:uncharacterized protein LOC129407613 isoform X2 [Boleophthalmus pectinirostris]
MVTSRTRLLLLLLLPLSVSNAEFMDQTVKEEEDVILSCGEETRTQCESTDWIYRKDFRTTTDLFRRGQTTGEGAGTLLSDCSLHLPRVTKDQRGTYKCKQNEKEKHHILLYVASLSQRVENDRVTFNCSVASPGKCQHDFKWFNNNEEVTTDHKDLKISRSDSWCDLSVSFNDPSPPSEFYQTLKCEVKQNYPTQIFTFVPRPPDEKTTEPPTTSRPGTSTSATAAPTFSTDISTQVKVQDQTNSPSPFTRLLVSVVVPVVVCVALLLICVALVLWRKLSGNKNPNLNSPPAVNQNHICFCVRHTCVLQSVFNLDLKKTISLHKVYKCAKFLDHLGSFMYQE